MENWKKTGVLNKFEEIQICAYLHKGKSVSLFLHILWSTEDSPDPAWDTNIAEIMSNCQTRLLDCNY